MRLPEESLSAAAPVIEMWPRLAWLLVMSRIHQPRGRFASRAAVLDHLASRGVSADAARLSKWESGQHAVPGRVLETYEDMLSTPPGSLLGLASVMSRASEAPMTAAWLRGSEEPLDQDVLEDLLERATTPTDGVGPRLSGSEWMTLALELTRFEAVFLERSVWRRLCRRLVSELARTTGRTVLPRYEAAVALLTHPGAARHLLGAVEEWLDDPDVQVVEQVVSLLATTAAPEAGEVVVRLVTAPHHLVRDAAMRTAAIKAARGHFRAAGLTRLEDVLVDWLAASGPRPGPIALDLASSLPDESRRRVLGRVTSPQQRDRIRRHASAARLVDPDLAARLTRAVVDSALKQMDLPSDTEASPLLLRLVQEHLFHVSGGRRLLAGMVLSLSPYESALTGVYLSLAHGPDASVAAAAWEALRRFDAVDFQDALVRTATSDASPWLRQSALAVLRGASGPLRADHAEAVVALVTATVDPSDAPLRATAVSVLGLRAPGRLAEVSRWVPELAPTVEWWSATGPVLRDR